MGGRFEFITLLVGVAVAWPRGLADEVIE